MDLDLQLTQLGLKWKQLVVFDLSFPYGKFPEFKSAYEVRYIHIPLRQGMALEMAAGMANQGKIVVIYGSNCDLCEVADMSLNVKVLKEKEGTVWDYFEEQLLAFGPSIISIPLSSA